MSRSIATRPDGRTREGPHPTRGVPFLAVVALIAISTFTLDASGHDDRFGDCPQDYECTPGDLSPPDAVTGHTVFAKFLMTRVLSDGPDGFPVRFPSHPVVRAPDSHVPMLSSASPYEAGATMGQAECVVWTNGKNFDVHPAGDLYDHGSENGFFSDDDEDRFAPRAVAPYGDESSQDYDPDRYIDTCLPIPSYNDASRTHGRPSDFAAVAGYFEHVVPRTFWSPVKIDHGMFAVVVELGDCDPANGRDFHFRGHLDFVDPNNLYHEVQEYEYTCGGAFDRGGPGGNSVPAGDGLTSDLTTEVVTGLFPSTSTDPRNEQGCTVYAMPGDPDVGVRHGSVNSTDPGDSEAPEVRPSVDETQRSFDLGHKCNGSIRDLFTERLWITPIHEPVYDARMAEDYTFALVLDTCSGRNIAEGWDHLTGTHRADGWDHLLDRLGLGLPLAELCHDGSSFSFDDTSRGRTVHAGPPANGEEVKHGNAYDANATSTTFGKHRQNCRVDRLDWPYNDHPGQSRAQVDPLGLIGSSVPRNPVGEDCFREDHKTAQIDIYVFDSDPTGLFDAHSNGMTGANAYVEGMPSGPDYDGGH